MAPTRWLLIGAAGVLAGALATHGVSYAHAHMATFLPAPNAVVNAAPAELKLSFTEALSALTVEVYDAKGQKVHAGPAQLDPTNPMMARVPMQAQLAPGAYTVKWMATSTDGHQSEGRYTYHVTDVQPDGSVKLFWNGQLVQGDVPTQIIDGRTMVPVRALAESLGMVVDWDQSRKFVTVSPAPATGGHSHSAYVHPEGTPAPTLDLEVFKDKKAGYVLHVKTTNWTWAPLAANGAAVPNEGHGHLYVDGVKVNRLYGEWYHLEGLTPGQHDITVTLNANDHSEYAVAGEHGPTVLKATVSIAGDAIAPVGSDDHAHDHGTAEHDHGTEGHDHDH
jgi:methionine-rich copper-binding protein CopC